MNAFALCVSQKRPACNAAACVDGEPSIYLHGAWCLVEDQNDEAMVVIQSELDQTRSNCFWEWVLAFRIDSNTPETTKTSGVCKCISDGKNEQFVGIDSS